jgi:hypothetical protein
VFAARKRPAGKLRSGARCFLLAGSHCGTMSMPNQQNHEALFSIAGKVVFISGGTRGITAGMNWPIQQVMQLTA